MVISRRPRLTGPTCGLAWFRVGLVVAIFLAGLMLSGCAWFADPAPELDQEPVTTVVWPQGRPTGPLEDDSLVQYLRDFVIRDAASFNSFNFSLTHVDETGRLHSSLRGHVGDLGGQLFHKDDISQIWSGPLIFEPLEVERYVWVGEGVRRAEHLIHACVAFPQRLGLWGDEIFVNEQTQGHLHSFRIIQDDTGRYIIDSARGMPRVPVGTECEFTGDPPVAWFDPQPDPNILRYITVDMIVPPRCFFPDDDLCESPYFGGSVRIFV